MIIVTGTKRSGTSMWMQILDAAGFEVIGDPFPKDWDQTIHDANPRGFYESKLRSGVKVADDGPLARVNPEESGHLAAKIFVPGMTRTDPIWISNTIATVRHWREYAASIRRLYAMEAEANDREIGPRFDPILQWWLENFALLRDVAVRRYPVFFVSYDAVVERPAETLPPILQWLDAPTPDAGVAVVSPETRTQNRKRVEGFHEFAPVFDELYFAVHEGRALDREFVKWLNYHHLQLLKEIEASLELTRRAGTSRSPFVRRLIPTEGLTMLTLQPSTDV